MSFVKLQIKMKDQEYPIVIGNNILDKVQVLLK